MSLPFDMGLLTRERSEAPDVIAPDGSEVRVLASVPRGSMAQFTLPPGEGTALALFDQVMVAWNLGATHRDWLSWAARVHEVGLAISHSQHQMHGAYLLAHSDLFRAGIARSGAYNRTLTPFGFQDETRNFWEATNVYTSVSPFYYANKINEPILLIHGEADNNQGTFPIQSERLFAAISGLGGTARLVMLPYESHGYSAKESTEHTLFEMVRWLDKYVKNAKPR